MLDHNIILCTDSYKVSHWKQYPPGTTRIYSYLEARGGGPSNDVTFFGLQYILDRLSYPTVSDFDIVDAKPLLAAHFGRNDLFNETGWRRIVEVHNGHLPLSIRAIPEGMTVPIGNVLMTVENTDPELPWLTNYVETLLAQVWYPCTIATQSRHLRKTVERFLEETGDDPAGFKVHDFGYRGSTGVEAAGVGAAAHLVSFMGTDTLAGILMARNYYNCDMAGFSIPAAEHSTITSWGREHEVDAYRNMLDQYPEGLVAVVSDSYNILNACGNLWGDELRERVLARDGVLIIRPDSGDPVDTVLAVLHTLGERFPVTKNAKGYKVLDRHVRIIQGDGIDPLMVFRILDHMKDAGWSADNIAFGSGGGLLQKVNRDTHGFAMKCSAVEIAGAWHDVYKEPITDLGKRSKRGRLKLIRDEAGEYRTVNQSEPGDDLLVEVFRDGQMLVEYNFDEVRDRARL